MKKAIPKYPRILAIAPSTRGFGFAVIEGLNILVDWGVKSIIGNKSIDAIKKVKEMVIYYQPDVVVVKDTSGNSYRHFLRMRMFTKQIVRLVASQDITVISYSREQVSRALLSDDSGTKYAIATKVAATFPDELGFRLPPKRRPWMSEDYRMQIFDAVALALTVRKVVQMTNYKI